MKKYVECKLESEVFEILKLWNTERKKELKEKNWGTREPVFKVQRREYVSCQEEFGYDEVELCIEIGGDFNSFKDIEEVKEYYHKDYFSSEEEYNKVMELVGESDNIFDLYNKFDDLFEEDMIKPNQCYLYYSQENWVDISYFLTYKEAKEYTQYQSHNLGVCRVYIDYPGYANKSTLNKFLEILDKEEIFEEVQ